MPAVACEPEPRKLLSGSDISDVPSVPLGVSDLPPPPLC